MKSWAVVAVCLVWSVNLLEGTVENELCAEGLPLGGSANAVLSLNCNTSHLACHLNLENTEYSADSYTYYVGVVCNGTQTTLYQVLLSSAYYNAPEYKDQVSHSLPPGTECTLFGCYREGPFWSPSYYAMQPALCVIDGDECYTHTHNCSEHAVCINAVGGYNCSCKEGYSGDGFHCTDVDECLGVNHTCAVNAHCVNVPGSYLCVCGAGYTGDGYHCSNVDECASGIFECDPHSNCTDTEGSYLCVCEQMYEGDGFNCTAVVSDNSKKVMAVLVVPVALFLCLIAAVIIVNWRRRPIRMFQAEWGPKELDKDYNPVSLNFVPSGSEVSIIESLHHEDVQPGPLTQAGDSLVSQSVSLSWIGIEESQGTSRERVVSAEESEGVAVEGVAAEKTHNTAAHAQCNSHEGNDLHLSSAFTTIPVPSLKVETLVTTPSNPRTNAQSHDHDESGFLSDTSSYVYYFELSGKQ